MKILQRLRQPETLHLIVVCRTRQVLIHLWHPCNIPDRRVRKPRPRRGLDRQEHAPGRFTILRVACDPVQDEDALDRLWAKVVMFIFNRDEAWL